MGRVEIINAEKIGNTQNHQAWKKLTTNCWNHSIQILIYFPKICRGSNPMELSRTTWSYCSDVQNNCTIQIIKYQTHIWTFFFSSLSQGTPLQESYTCKPVCEMYLFVALRKLNTGCSWTEIWREAWVCVCVCRRDHKSNWWTKLGTGGF